MGSSRILRRTHAPHGFKLMSGRPSEPLLAMLRKVANEKKLNTAALASAAKVPRSRMKHILSGGEPMTVDEFILLSQVLELDPTGMAESLEEEATDDPEAAASLRTVGRRESVGLDVDPLGNHSWQIVQLGLMLGIDMFVVLDASQLEGSGVPKQVLGRYPEHLPLRLDAAYHHHHQATYLPAGLQVRLSFDALYTCVIPWDAFTEVRLSPLPPEPVEVAPEPDPEPDPDPTDASPRRGHLRLV